MSFQFTKPTFTNNQQLYYDFALSTLPPNMADDPQIQIMISLMATLLGNIQDNIDNFTSLVDVDTCPEQFLPLLSGLIGYNYDPNLDVRLQRILLRNYVRLRDARGSVMSIKLALRYGSNLPLSFDDPSLSDIVITPYSTGSSDGSNQVTAETIGDIEPFNMNLFESYTIEQLEYLQGAVEKGGVLYTGPGIYKISAPYTVPITIENISLVNPAGFLPIIELVVENTINFRETASVQRTVLMFEEMSYYTSYPTLISEIENSSYGASMGTIDPYKLGIFTDNIFISNSIQIVHQ